MENTNNQTINQQKLDYLKSLGVEIQDYTLEDGKSYNAYVSFNNDYDYNIDFNDFEIGDSLLDIERSADIISCCGDILDTDYMICPTCKEHC